MNVKIVFSPTGAMFKTLEQEMAMKMQEQTLGDCIDAILMREQKSI